MTNPDIFFEDGTFIPSRLMKHTINNNQEAHFITPRTDDGGDTIWLYHPDRGIFTPDGNGYVKDLCHEALGYRTHSRRVNEIVNLVQYETYTNPKDFEEKPGLVVLKNGVYHIDTHEFTDHSPTYFAKSALPVTYDPDATCPAFLKFLERVAPTYMELLQEWTGYHFLKDQRYQRFVILLGDGDNGKSTYLHVLTHLLGTENVTGQSLYRLATNRFAIAELYEKMANIAADIGPTELKLTGALKIATGEDRGSAERKFKDPFDFMNYGKLSFSCNQLPKTPDETLAFHKRPFVLLFNVIIPVAEQDKTLKARLIEPEELSGIFNWALEGLHRLMERGNFNEPTTIQERQTQYRRLSNPVLAFASDYVIEDVDEWELSDNVYKTFVQFCTKNGFVAPTDSVFFKELKKHVFYHKGQKTINKQRVRVLLGIKLRGTAQGAHPTQGVLPKEGFEKRGLVDIPCAGRAGCADTSSEEQEDPHDPDKDQLFKDAKDILEGRDNKMEQRELFDTLMRMGYHQGQASTLLRADPRFRFMGLTVRLAGGDKT